MYYALSLNAGSLPGSVYFTTFLAGAVEVPANLIAMFFMAWHVTGRRLTCSLSLIIAGAASLISIYMILESKNGFMFHFC
jgi:OCT family organic cation transporter-like MFS transporter 4/5